MSTKSASSHRKVLKYLDSMQQADQEETRSSNSKKDNSKALIVRKPTPFEVEDKSDSSSHSERARETELANNSSKRTKSTKLTSENVISDSEDGGAPLHPDDSDTSPTQRVMPDHRDAEEMALVHASNQFNDDNVVPGSPVQPRVPQSVAPMANTFGPAPGYTPQRRNTNQQRGNQQAGTRYRQSFSSNQSSGSGYNSSYSSGYNSSFVNIYTPESNPNGQPDPSNGMNAVNARILAARSYINMTPGVTQEVARRHNGMLTEISHLLHHVGGSIIQQRDEAVKAKEEEHERFKRALYDEAESKVHRDKLQDDLKVALRKEKEANERVLKYQKQLDSVKAQLKQMDTAANTFRQHHLTLCRNYEKQDEKYIRQIAELEDEIKVLRLKTGTTGEPKEMSAVMQPPSVPESSASVEANDSTDDTASQTTDSIIFKGKAPLREAAARDFKPNPEATPWVPTPGSKGVKVTKGAPRPEGGAPLWELYDDGTGTPNKTSAKKQTPATPGPSKGATSSSKGPSTGSKGPTTASSSQRKSSGASNPALYGSTHGHSSQGFDKKEFMFEESLLNDTNEIGNPHRTDRWNHEDVRAAINHLYEMVKGTIVNLHKQGPPNVRDDALAVVEPKTWQYLTSIVHSNSADAESHMKYLLSHPAYRNFILHRLILDYLFKNIFAPALFLGFTKEMDQHLLALQEKMSSLTQSPRTAANSRIRQRVIEEHARLVKAILAHNKAGAFRDKTVETHTAVLLEILRPMRSARVGRDFSARTLRVLVRGCWNASTKIWSSDLTLHYNFPECGGKFAMATMEALNGTALARSAEHLQFSQYRTSLVVAPTLTLRDDRESHQQKTYGIRKAEVLVMK